MIKVRKIDTKKIGFFLMMAYICSNYIVHDIGNKFPFLQISLYGLLGITIFNVIRYRDFQKVRGFNLWSVILVIVSFFNMLYAPEVHVFSGHFWMLLTTILILFAMQLYVETEDDFQKLCWCYAISSLILLLYLIFSGNFKGSASDRLGQEEFGNANTFASLIMTATLMTLWLLIYGTYKKSWKILLAICIIADMAALAFSAGRKFFIIPFVFLYLLMFFKKDKKGRKHIIKYTLIFAGILVITVTLLLKVPVLHDAIGVRLEGLLENMAGAGDGGELSAIYRKEMRQEAIARWTERPIFGYGFDSFGMLTSWGVYSHCNYTELLHNGGVVYFVIFYWIYFRILQLAYKNKSKISNKGLAFAVSTVICMLMYDYGAVSYTELETLSLIMWSYKFVTLKAEKSMINNE